LAITLEHSRPGMEKDGGLLSDDFEDVAAHSLFDDVAHLFLDSTFADVYFIVGQGDGKERIPAHRLVLSAKNLIFERMLYSDEFNPRVASSPPLSSPSTAGSSTTLSREADIVIRDLDPQNFKSLLQAIYTGAADVTKDNAADLLSLANRYQVDELRAVCLAYLKSNMDAEAACTLFEESGLVLGDQHVAGNYMQQYTQDAVKTQAFLRLSRPRLRRLL